MTNVDSSIRPIVETEATPDAGSQFRSMDEKKQLQLINQLIETGESSCRVLIDYLQAYQDQGRPLSSIGLVNPVAAKAYRQLWCAGFATDWLKATFPQGIVPLRSEANVDYQPLQDLLQQQSWLEADKLHNLKLCEASGAAALSRKWIYFSEAKSLPIADLQTLNALWMAYSDGKFGYSVQRELWLASSKNWDKFWPRLLWKDGNTWTRYPGGFQWNLDAPKGHLPLSNQLRGVQVINALMNHPAWDLTA
jgi:GUN4-like/ARM-like repeat domain, GUN4-N terminal